MGQVADVPAAPRYVITAKLNADLENQFQLHRAFGDQAARYTAIRNAGLVFARVIAENTPVSADQNAALRKVREAVFTANAAIACGEKDSTAA